MAEATTTNRPIKIIVGVDDFDTLLKDALVSHLRSLNINVEDLRTSSYYSIGAEVGHRVCQSSSSSIEIRGLVSCGTGIDVFIFTHKFLGVFANTCLNPSDAINTRSINNSNVLVVSEKSTSSKIAIEILNTWLKTPFKFSYPANDNKPWPQ